MFKYKIRYNGEEYLGNSVDGVAASLFKAGGFAHINDAIRFVNKNIVPVVKGVEVERVNVNRKRVHVTLADAKNGAISALRQIGGNVVDQNEINRRAAICTNCPLKGQISGCMGCGLAAKITNFVNTVKGLWGASYNIPNDLKKNHCQACGCSLAMMLPAELQDFTEKERTNKLRPNFCWVKG